jgi:hypothetical protein
MELSLGSGHSAQGYSYQSPLQLGMVKWLKHGQWNVSRRVAATYRPGLQVFHMEFHAFCPFQLAGITRITLQGLCHLKGDRVYATLGPWMTVWGNDCMREGGPSRLFTCPLLFHDQETNFHCIPSNIHLACLFFTAVNVPEYKSQP